MLDFIIAALLTFIGLFVALNTSALLLWVERKGSALVQDRIGANRANIFGGLLPFNVGLINTLVADLMMVTSSIGSWDWWRCCQSGCSFCFPWDIAWCVDFKP